MRNGKNSEPKRKCDALATAPISHSIIVFFGYNTGKHNVSQKSVCERAADVINLSFSCLKFKKPKSVQHLPSQLPHSAHRKL